MPLTHCSSSLWTVGQPLNLSLKEACLSPAQPGTTAAPR